MVGRGVGVAQETEHQTNGLIVEGGIDKARGMRRGCHDETPEPCDLGVRNRDAASDAGRENALTLEEAVDHGVGGVHQLGPGKGLTEEPEELGPITDVRRDQHQIGIESL